MIRSKERAVLAITATPTCKSPTWKKHADSFIRPAQILRVVDVAGVSRRAGLFRPPPPYLPDQYRTADRAALMEEFTRLKLRASGR